MKTRSEKTKQLVKLASENPELPIQVTTNFEVIGGDDFDYWVGEVSEVFVDYAYMSEAKEKWIWGKDEIEEALADEIENTYPGFLDEVHEEFYLDSEFKRLLNEGKIFEAIIVRVDP